VSAPVFLFRETTISVHCEWCAVVVCCGSLSSHQNLCLSHLQTKSSTPPPLTSSYSSSLNCCSTAVELHINNNELRNRHSGIITDKCAVSWSLPFIPCLDLTPNEQLIYCEDVAASLAWWRHKTQNSNEYLTDKTWLTGRIFYCAFLVN